MLSVIPKYGHGFEGHHQNDREIYVAVGDCQVLVFFTFKEICVFCNSVTEVDTDEN
jgi:hypothetical protein